MTDIVPTYKQISAQKRAVQASLIPPEWRITPPTPLPLNVSDYITSQNLLSEAEQKITASSLTSLLESLHSGTVTSEEVTKAFCHRAALAQQLCGCLTEILFEEAIEDAKKKDAEWKAWKEAGCKEGGLRALHGLPVSVKDLFDIKGVDTCVGWVCNANKPAPKDSYPVQTLRKMGAILYCKTNIPQSMMMSDSYNHIFGQSVNSLNTNLISGGSSGGEAALVGCAGSPIGIGTDIGGSIRIPAALQGLYSLMPCVGRQPYHHKGPAQKTIISVAGPFARDIENLEIYMQALEKAEPWTIDPQCVPVPWRRELATVPAGKKLRIGYVVDDGMVKCQPPIERTMRETIEKLKKEGHELFEWDTSSHAFGYQIWLKAILADGGAGCAKLCAAGSQPLIQGMLVGTSDDLMTPSELHELNHLKQEFQRSYLARWNDMEADALILPVTPWVGYTPKTWVKSSQNVGYTALYNLLNYAAVTVPVGVVEAGEAGVDAKGAQDWNAWRDIKEWRSESDRFNWEQYDPDLVNGMPICIQVVGGHYGDENAVAVAKEVDRIVKASA